MIASFEDYNKMKKELIRLVDDYIRFNDDFREKYVVAYDYNFHGCYDFSFDEKGTDEKYFRIFYYYNDKFYDKTIRDIFTSIPKKEYEELKKFMENPELYKSVKKYNL